MFDALGDQFGVLDVVALRFDDARADDLAVGHTEALECCPLVCMTRVRTLEQHGAWLGGPDDVDEVVDGNVVVVRPGIVAPAQVHAQLFDRDVPYRMVECCDVHLDGVAELLEAHVGVGAVATHGEVGAVELQGGTRRGDGFVFVTHRFSDGEHVFLACGVVLVAEEQRDDAGGRGAAEDLLDTGFLRGTSEFHHVFHRGLGVFHSDGTGARRCGSLAAARVVGHLLGTARVIDEVLEVVVLHALTLEAAEAVFHVGGVRGLRHLSVVDDGDAGRLLALHHQGGGAGDALVECHLVHRNAVADRPHQLDEVVGPGKAAGVRAGDVVRGHGSPLGASALSGGGCRCTLTG